MERLNQKNDNRSPEQTDETDNRDVITKELTKPGTGLIMPDEETKIRNGEGVYPRVFDSHRISNSPPKSNPHEIGIESFGRVYANNVAKAEITKEKPSFPVGSIIVREKYISTMDIFPQVVTAMVKREKNFSKKTGDWEFFTFTGSGMSLQKRQTKSDCAKCHTSAKNTDWVFKTYLK